MVPYREGSKGSQKIFQEQYLESSLLKFFIGCYRLRMILWKDGETHNIRIVCSHKYQEDVQVSE
jgi:hypothetical protein